VLRTGFGRYTARVTIIFLISAMALAGFRPFGHTFAQFMIVWQR
jgi:formate hydrogenlyase subunit 3/multisubunit Na+/H+ antiporter MnhD subunit